MKAYFAITMCLVATLGAHAQQVTNAIEENTKVAPAPSLQKEAPAKSNGPIDVLTDTRGYDLHPYLTEKVLPTIKQNWYNLIPEVARPPIMKQGEVILEFKLSRDGKLTDLRLKKSSGDVSLDRAAFGGVAYSSPLSPLPSDYQCRDVSLRFHFYYNPDKKDVYKPDDSSRNTIPCVTTKIKGVEGVALLISPEAVNVRVGDVQQFSARLTGAASVVVKWSLQGRGCEGSTCGTVSADGLFTAPAKLPNPATITITARSESAPDAIASATVTILNSEPQQ